MNRTKEVKENIKTLKKEMEEDLRRWKDLPCSCVGRINIIQIAILPSKSALPIQCNTHSITNAILH